LPFINPKVGGGYFEGDFIIGSVPFHYFSVLGEHDLEATVGIGTNALWPQLHFSDERSLLLTTNEERNLLATPSKYWRLRPAGYPVQ
jgi:hypothetical protein